LLFPLLKISHANAKFKVIGPDKQSLPIVQPGARHTTRRTIDRPSNAHTSEDHHPAGVEKTHGSLRIPD